ncbi:hypothetical protein C4559_05970 [Candidatus Microgenomates bacterium]|nr:MAG: hypothetical protein C4559_05970 [Candidatus Microgenomates bacterium]
MVKKINFVKNNCIEILIIIFSIIFSLWLMFSSFSYNNGSILISTKAWSDFASHVPLIRSFSFGDNFPPQYPIFPGEQIRYHFLFYAIVGLLEKTGLRIDYALNIPSALSFGTLLIIIYFLAKSIFKNKAIGILSVVFFLFNSSFSFLEFLKTHPLSLNAIGDIFINSSFPSFGPYDGKIVSAFWNLNIYTNQRHLALPLAFLFLIVFFITKGEEKKKTFPLFLIIIFGLVIGILPFSHSSIFIMVYAVFGILFLLFKHQRKRIFLMLFIGGLISLPRVMFLKETASYTPHLQIGYLISSNFNFLNFFNYWFMNLGLSFILIPIGVILSSNFQRKIFLSFFSLFLIANLVQLSPEIAGNHKFLNAFLIVGNMFSAFVIFKLWKTNLLAKFIVPIILFFLILSGIIDFFPIKNDNFIPIDDYKISPDIKWIMDNTPKNSVFLNSSYLYNPASLAGRKIFLGWPYFAWSLGYDTQQRDTLRKNLFDPKNLSFFCNNIKKYNLKYAIIENQNNDFTVNSNFFEKEFPKIYYNKINKLKIYELSKNCR